jgi:hypothetical protein
MPNEKPSRLRKRAGGQPALNLPVKGRAEKFLFSVTRLQPIEKIGFSKARLPITPNAHALNLAFFLVTNPSTIMWTFDSALMVTNEEV